MSNTAYPTELYYFIYIVANPATRGLLNRHGKENKRKSTWYCLKKNRFAPIDLLSIPQSRGGNVKTFRWDHRLQIQNLFMAFKRVPLW